MIEIYKPQSDNTLFYGVISILFFYKGYIQSMCKVIFFLFSLLNFVHAENDVLNAYDHIRKAYPTVFKKQKSTVAETDKEMKIFFSDASKYIIKTYHPILERLRNGEKCKTADIYNALKNDVLMTYTGQGGHDKFTCDLLGITFCVKGHGSNDIEDGEYDGFLASLQQYIDAIKNFRAKNKDLLVEKLKSMKASDLHVLIEKEKERYEKYDK